MIGYLDGCTEEDIEDVALNLRVEDKRTCQDFGRDPLTAFLQAYYMGHVRTMVADDGDMEAVGLFGWHETGYLWMASTPRISRVYRALARGARKLVEGLPFELTYTYVDPRNQKDVRFIEWLGFMYHSAFNMNDQEYHVYIRN